MHMFGYHAMGCFLSAILGTSFLDLFLMLITLLRFRRSGCFIDVIEKTLSLQLFSFFPRLGARVRLSDAGLQAYHS